MEIWKTIPGFEHYEVSNKGRVKSLKFGKERILKPGKGLKYLLVVLKKNAKTRKTIQVHQLVAMAFLNHKPNGNKGFVVDHIDNNPLNNNLNNLQLITNRENSSKDKKGYSSKYIGVNWDKNSKKWKSSIQINGRLKHLGLFKNPKIAHAVYLNKLENL